jgi:hypothetical protein
MVVLVTMHAAVVMLQMGFHCLVVMMHLGTMLRMMMRGRGMMMHGRAALLHVEAIVMGEVVFNVLVVCLHDDLLAILDFGVTAASNAVDRLDMAALGEVLGAALNANRLAGVAKVLALGVTLLLNRRLAVLEVAI